jgi:hypothetical protein
VDVRPSLLPLLLLLGCGPAGPIVSVQHQLGARTLVRNVRYNGCVWPAAIQTGAYTIPPKPCLSGPARVYFEKYDLDSATATWAGYQSSPLYDPPGGEDALLALTPGTIEPDLTAPGPFGH